MSKHGDFRTEPRDVRDQASERDVPEQREGAGPADADSPEFSRGQPLDDAQPSARARDELDEETPEANAADLSDQEGSLKGSERAYLEALLEGVPLPATKADLVTYAKRSGGQRFAGLLRSLPEGRYDWIDQVGEALEPVQPKWPRERRIPKAESGLPPGGPGYGTGGGETAR